MYNRLSEMMVSLQPRKATESSAHVLLDEEDEHERVLLVECETRLYAMNVTGVREVLRLRGVTRVPGSPAVVLGLVNVRGMVVTVLGLAACLRTPGHYKSGAETLRASGVTVRRTEMDGSVVLLEHGGRLVGLAVDAVRDVRRVLLDALREPLDHRLDRP